MHVFIHASFVVTLYQVVPTHERLKHLLLEVVQHSPSSCCQFTEAVIVHFVLNVLAVSPLGLKSRGSAH